MLKTTYFSSLVCLIALAGSAVAQERTDSQKRDAQSTEKMQSHIADCMLLANAAEITLLELGVNETDNPELRNFAEKMIQDHQNLCQKLSQFASKDLEELKSQISQDSTRRGDSSDRSRETRQQDRAQQDRNRDSAEATRLGSDQDRRTSQSDTDMASQLFQVEVKAAAECVKLTSADLRELDKTEFDQAFLGLQTAAHISMLAKLNALEECVSGDMQSIVKEAQQSTKEHKQQAEEMMKQLKDYSNKRESDRR